MALLRKDIRVARWYLLAAVAVFLLFSAQLVRYETAFLWVGIALSSALKQRGFDISKSAIHRYGQELSPWAMLYMMFAVVVPSLGVTMIIVISSFLGIEIPTIIFPAVLAFLIGFQLFFMSFISSRRPLV